MVKLFFVFLLTLSTSALAFSQVRREVTGKPYSAEQTSELVQTLADGTHIKQTISNGKIYRDSQGRTRTERQMLGPTVDWNAADSPISISIVDPVAHVYYFFNSKSKTVRRQEMPTPQVGGRSAPPVKSAVQSNPLQPEIKSEKLDPQTIEGIAVEGRRFTTTYPVGSFGNDREIVTTNEVWSSSELRVTILSKSEDPRTGEHTQKLTNISRDEPDPSLFQPPADYEVVEEPKR